MILLTIIIFTVIIGVFGICVIAIRTYNGDYAATGCGRRVHPVD